MKLPIPCQTIIDDIYHPLVASSSFQISNEFTLRAIHTGGGTHSFRCFPGKAEEDHIPKWLQRQQVDNTNHNTSRMRKIHFHFNYNNDCSDLPGACISTRSRSMAGWVGLIYNGWALGARV